MGKRKLTKQKISFIKSKIENSEDSLDSIAKTAGFYNHTTMKRALNNKGLFIRSLRKLDKSSVNAS